MAKPKTTLQKIDALQKKSQVIREQIIALQDECPHSKVRVDRRPVGFNGYSTDYITYCDCELCGKSWVHDGYCSGTGHAQHPPTERNA